MAYPNLANGWITTLAGSLTNVATTVDVASTSGIPARSFQAVILAEGANTDEIVTVSGLTGSTITISRATEANATGSSSASAHSSGATIAHVLTKQALTDATTYATGNKWTTGTSMPGSPATNDRVTRTDLGMDFYYDGTRWLSCQEFSLHGSIIDALMPLSAGGASAQYMTVDEGPSSAGAYVTRFQISTLVATTNNGTNYWTLTPRSSSPTGTQHNLGSAFTTAGDTVNVWARHIVSVGSVVTSGDTQYRFDVTKTLSPGVIYYLAAVFYRLIVT